MEITIGIPVHNGELFIEKTLRSVLSQSFKDFIVIISDNASTDSTLKICKEFAKQDNRIKIYQQQQDLGLFSNFRFVLEKATSKYFIWLAADDYWEPSFLEKNYKVLESDSNVVGSISKENCFSKINLNEDNSSHNKNENNGIYFLQLPSETIQVSGTFEKKIEICINNNVVQNIYSLFRTDKLKDSFFKDLNENCFDRLVLLDIIRYGDLHLIDDVLIHRYAGGSSNKNCVEAFLEKKMSLKELLFPYFPIITWCLKNLRWKAVLKNLKTLFILSISGPLSASFASKRLIEFKLKLRNSY